MSRLKDKRYIVTGAASGIGRAIARRFVEEEARVLFTDLDKQKADVVAKEAGSPLAKGFELDVTLSGHFEKAMEFVTGEWGGLDGIVNNAGYGVAAQAPDTTEEEWQQVIDISLKGVFWG